MAKSDAEKFGVKAASMVTIASRRGEIKAKVKISREAVPGTIFIPFHFAEAAANRLTHAALDPVSKIPEFKVCAVTVSPIPSS
jgi:predicted molibdopterin-dependent oxidoreductase YjgC